MIFNLLLFSWIIGNLPLPGNAIITRKCSTLNNEHVGFIYPFSYFSNKLNSNIELRQLNDRARDGQNDTFLSFPTTFNETSRAQFPSLSLTRRNLDPIPGGYIEQLKPLYESGLLSTSHYFHTWPDEEIRTVDLFTTSLEPRAAIVPGQKTFLTLPSEERKRVVKSFNDNKTASLFIGWVEKNSSPIKSDNLENKQNVNLVGYAAIASIIDLKLFDRNGEIGLQVIGRCKIKDIKQLDDDHCMVDIIPHRDILKPFSNPVLTWTYIRDIHSLYDRCNRAEAIYREQEGQSDIAEIVKIRSKLHEKVDDILYELDNPSDTQIAEYLSFCAMDYHFDAKTRCWALELQDTETRLSLVYSILQEKLKLLKSTIDLKNKNDF